MNRLQVARLLLKKRLQVFNRRGNRRRRLFRDGDAVRQIVDLPDFVSVDPALQDSRSRPGDLVYQTIRLS